MTGQLNYFSSGPYGSQRPKEVNTVAELSYNMEIRNLLIELTSLIRKFTERMDNAEKPSAQGGNDA